MKLFVLYILGSFMIGVVVWRRPWATRVKILVGLCLFVCIGYYFFHQI